MHSRILTLLLVAGASVGFAQEKPFADLIVQGGTVLTLDAKSSQVEAVAVRGGKIVAVGSNDMVMSRKGPKTQVIDATGKTVMPGLYDSHMHPVGAALSEANGEIPLLLSIDDVLNYVRAQVKTTPEGKWIVIRYAFPTRLKEGRFPTKAELDDVAPKHPVLYHAGPAGVCNTTALIISGITKESADPPNGRIVRDVKTGEPTGMLRNALGLLKGVPGSGASLKPEEKLNRLKQLFALYNSQGLTSIADRNGSTNSLNMYRQLRDAGTLTVRVNVARGFSSSGTREQIAKRFDDLSGKDGKDGPTGAGDDWVRIGPIKLFLDGGMLSGTAYMRTPWPKGSAYQVTENDYRGLLFIPPEQMKVIAEEGAKKKWQVTAHCAGEGGMDVLLDAYEFANRMKPIRDLRFCITHANFPSQHNLERCQALGVVADVQPAWLYKDGAPCLKVLGAERMRWFQPYKTWMQYTTIGGGSDHMLRMDPLQSTNPWHPWLGIWEAVTRRLDDDTIHQADEALTREQALRLYTINNAYLCHEEKVKGSLEPGKLGDFIILDRNPLTCTTDELRETKVLATIVNGKVVYQQ